METPEEASGGPPGAVLSDLSTRQRVGSYVALYTSIVAWGMSFAGLVPLMALVLEDRGTNPVLIGLVAAANPIGVIIAAPLVAPVVRRLGTANSMILASIGAIITVAMLPVLDTVIGWLFLRFLNGLCGAVPWVVTETWINAIAVARTRGRITALYGGFMATGFAMGPILLTTVGTVGALPFLYFAGLMSISLIPILIVKHLAPALHLPRGIKLSGFFLTVPTIMGAGFVCGLTDTSLFSFLPIWAKEAGLDKDTAIQILSIFVVGTVFMTLPIGWLADHVNKRLVLIGCSIMCVIGPFSVTTMAPTMAQSLWVVGVILFFWGGCAWALYNVGLAMLGERFQAGSLAASNAAFVVAYEIANIAGPPAAGFAMVTWENHGLMTFMGSVAAIYTVIAAARGVIRRRLSS